MAYRSCDIFHPPLGPSGDSGGDLFGPNFRFLGYFGECLSPGVSENVENYFENFSRINRYTEAITNFLLNMSYLASKIV